MTPIDYISFAEINFPGTDVNIKRYYAELILSHVLEISRIDLYTSKKIKITKELEKKINYFFQRIINDEPIQYILGSTQFRSIELIVDKSVLIPRPETELLVSYVIDKAKMIDYPVIADIGTGSGVIGLSILSELNSATVIAIDISREALEVAIKNKKLNDLENIYFIKGNLIECLKDKKVDIIVANLPYVSFIEYCKLSKNVKEYEPKLALTDDSDGTKLIKNLIIQSVKKLKERGWIFLEIGYEQGMIVSNFLKNNQFKEITVVKDLNQLDRIVIAQKF